MMDIDSLLDIIQLEKIDHGLFSGKNNVPPWGRVFGGQVLGQALNAAYDEMPVDRICHSLHGYFILSGDVNKNIIYQVDPIRDGGSFSTRRVTALQNGKAIFVMAASFQKKETGVQHQSTIPDVKQPESLKTDLEQSQWIKPFSPGFYKSIEFRDKEAIEFRPVEGFQIPSEENQNDLRNIWMKLKQEKTLSIPIQQQLLAYASDYNLLMSAVVKHFTEIKDPKKLFVASLDHAMYFHRDFDFNEWLLYSIDSPSASNARGMGYGKIFSKTGAHICTVIQEGLIRI